MMTRRQFGAGFGFIALTAVATIAGCDDGSDARTEETQKESDAARNASIEAMKKRVPAKRK